MLSTLKNFKFIKTIVIIILSLKKMAPAFNNININKNNM